MKTSFRIPDSCKLSTAEQTRYADTQTIGEFGIDSFTLMELAASSAARHLGERTDDNKHGLYVCGKGNNAGDALAVARYLMNDRLHTVSIYFVFGEDDLSEDTAKNLALLRKLKQMGHAVYFLDSDSEFTDHEFDYIVDGIFGTGLNSELRSPLPELIDTINELSVPLFAMDVPSGLEADSGKLLGGCVLAEATFTFGSNKVGFHLNHSSRYTGEVIYNPLPFPSVYRKWKASLLNEKLYQSLPSSRRCAKHKYDGGVVHILAGSAGLTGAAIMAAKSAWKQGAGAVFLYAPKGLLSIYEANLPHIITVGVGDTNDEHYLLSHREMIEEKLSDKPGTLLAGPGIGREEETGKLIKTILKHHEGPAVLDADALYFWDHLQSLPPSTTENWILTPHIGEAVTSLGASFDDDADRLDWSIHFKKKNQCSILLKGNPAFACIHNGENFITAYDTSLFARAGFGDVLSGALSAFLSISGEADQAVLHALYSGYKAFEQWDQETPPGPEDLLK